MPIKGLTEIRRLPRVGKIHLGVKVPNKSSAGEHPQATSYFVVPDSIKEFTGPEPTTLSIIIPEEDDAVWASQWYKCYSQTRGLICKGDGVTCRRMVDIKTGQIADKTSTEIAWKEGLDCMGEECPQYQRKACREIMCLQFMLPDVPGLGVWQVDTSSINSIRNINSYAAHIRWMCSHIRGIPLTLSLAPTEVINPDDGKKKTVHVMSLIHTGTLKALLAVSTKPIYELLAPPPDEREAPDDLEAREVLVAHPEQAEKDIEDLWGDQPKTKADAVSIKKAPEKPTTPTTATDSPIAEEIQELLDAVNWKPPTWRSWVKMQFRTDTTGDLGEVLSRLDPNQINMLKNHLTELRELK